MQCYFSPYIMLTCGDEKSILDFKSRNVSNLKQNIATSPYNFSKTIITFKCQEKIKKCVAGFQRRKSKRTHCLAFSLQIYISIL